MPPSRTKAMLWVLPDYPLELGLKNKPLLSAPPKRRDCTPSVLSRSASCSPGKLCLAGFNHTNVPSLAAFDPDNRSVEQCSGLKDDRIVVYRTSSSTELRSRSVNGRCGFRFCSLRTPGTPPLKSFSFSVVRSLFLPRGFASVPE